MENEENEIEKKHHLLLEKFLTKGDINSFRKMLSMDTNPKPKAKNNNLIRSLKSNPGYLYKKFSNNQNYVKTDDYSPLNVYSGYSKYDDYNLDRKSPFKDPDYKEKCLKGNYKVYSMKFNRMKMNWAKRRGIAYEDFQVPKIESYHKHQNKLLDGNSLGLRSMEIDVYSPEDELIKRNNEIMNNYLENNNIRYSQSLKLPRINSYGNPNRISSNNNLNNNYINNYQSININKFDIYNN